MEHMKNVARGLENKIIELQQKLTEKVKLSAQELTSHQVSVKAIILYFILKCLLLVLKTLVECNIMI